MNDEDMNNRKTTKTSMPKPDLKGVKKALIPILKSISIFV